MENALQPDGVEWRLCAYIIREGRPASSSQIKGGLKLPSLYWAEYYLSRMVRMGILDRIEENKYDMPEDIKWRFLISYLTNYKRRAVQRFHFYLSFVLALSLTYAYYFIYIPINITTNHLYALIFSLFSILTLIIEVMSFHRVRNNLGV